MKTLIPILSLLLFSILIGRAETTDSAGPYIVSPDHPATWTNGANVVHQALRWDADKHMLFADIKFSTVEYSSSNNTTEVEDYAVSFPSIKFDAQRNQFTSRGLTIASLKPGLFGSNVVLSKNMELDVQRHHHGEIYASIHPSYED